MAGLDDLVRSTPRPLLVGGVLAATIGLLFVIQPPHSLCDTQFEDFKKKQTGFIYIDPAAGKTQTIAGFKRAFDACLSPGTSPGACYPLFSKVRGVMRGLRDLDGSCRAEVAGRNEVKESLVSTFELLVKLAWGGKPPVDYIERRGWLDNADVSLFCDLQALTRLLYTDPAMDRLRERIMSELPKAGDLSRKDLWDRSLFSETCRDG
jgi:hypothetical protein